MFQAALAWSEELFGKEARGRYRRLIQCPLNDISLDAGRTGARDEQEIRANVRSYHISLSRARTPAKDRVRGARHVLYFRVEGSVVYVLRVLHDSMDAASRFTARDDF